MKHVMPNACTAKTFAIRLLAIVTFELAAGQAFAVPAFTISNTAGTPLSNPPFTLGWRFTTNTPITVNALGLFDSAQDGLVESHQIGLWNSGGSLVASGTVSSGTTNPLTNQFRYVTIGTVPLAVGTYQIGALFTTGNDPLIFPGGAASFATDPAIAFVDSRFAPGATLANPLTTTDSSPAYFGPNFLFNTATPAAVSEPGSAVLLGAALGAFGLSRRRRKK